MLQDEILHIQTFLAITSPLIEADVRRIFPDGCTMTWDSALIYNYFRAIGDGRVLLGGGDLLHTYAASPSKNLTGFIRRAVEYFATKFPGIRVDIEHAWSGMLGVSKDLLPVMGPSRVDDRVWYVGAATGLPWAAALGVYAAERILERRHELDEAFSPHRKFVIGSRLQAVLSKPLAYAISHGIAKMS